jgi:hypothetical protein
MNNNLLFQVLINGVSYELIKTNLIFYEFTIEISCDVVFDEISFVIGCI